MPARHDKVTDSRIAAGLLLARRGQAFFSRALNELDDDALEAPSLLPGWSRRHVVAHVGLNARALTRLTEWAATGIETPMYASPDQRVLEIEFAATLPAQALRNLSDHAAVHLTVEWRDLEDAAWASIVRTGQGRSVPASETVWLRTREVWIHAVDLASGYSFLDFPADLVDRLLEDITASWDRRRASEGLPSIRLEATDRDSTIGGDADVVLRGPAARLAQWASGRGAQDLVDVTGAAVPAPPRWL
ncbi:maleylpyruvate isomerase family mycothiol-dependent enzyme [Rathayibacter caricis]|uniref:maleylpyruvate isomerase family mycothiol-dependent enzyme n=1 Tax=Rathayibacter caricis TaxID=110936 RepID=UPI001FB2B643|nr:maleylpyruvate isomerase family mycothiol-dependent enzyme [Rathayibacter caricis]MCJ1697744.1 maleylpyruvate isomerase family mycothiol-dependent enzyme [Rathayibacter caricis]